ncbi:hypothetical protein CHLRE_01g034325v5 [Chlamydomonas reinhardtii]|uniref:Uncharacterized protein n=1 Tax=Chlamydomonas reinhardtii TaxID=3055 RepID=A0A2K3E6Y3_CHLRE|nr:uncharacterized protein CHLRE_01g034325v5 [Chlamydomonas reinhardtii]PNW88552.1 hypothetical protein CHLRE_01g034325v5 [Chlamydomonas reinhardtii]
MIEKLEMQAGALEGPQEWRRKSFGSGTSRPRPGARRRLIVVYRNSPVELENWKKLRDTVGRTCSCKASGAILEHARCGVLPREKGCGAQESSAQVLEREEQYIRWQL